MTFRPAYDEITLALGGNTVRLRPSLRAALHLSQDNGFATMHRQIAEIHLGTIRTLITIAATDRQEAAAFLDQIDRTPLQLVADCITMPLFSLVAGFIPATDDSDEATPKQESQPMPWPTVYRELYRTATGWLGWTPATAWNATPTEITEAFAGHIAKLKALHAPDTTDNAASDPDQRARNVKLGLDPDFDRNGLHALRGLQGMRA